MYPCDDTWEFINLAKEKKALSWCDARKCKRMHAQNVQYASLLVMRSQVQFSKDEEDIQSPLARIGSPGKAWQAIQPGSSSISCLHVHYTYLAKERKGCLQEKWPRCDWTSGSTLTLLASKSHQSKRLDDQRCDSEQGPGCIAPHLP